MPGSHVILQGPPGAEPDRETLHRTAAIVVYHSTARHAGVVAGSGTHVRDVSKPRGAKTGTMQIRHAKVCKVRPAPDDLAGEAGHAPASPLWRPAVTGASAGAGPRVPAWAEAATARQAVGPPRPPMVQ